jgi:hypothetical protein
MAQAGAVYTHTRDTTLSRLAGAVYTHTRDVPIPVIHSAVIYLQAQIQETSTGLGDSSILYLQAQIEETTMGLGDSAPIFLQSESSTPTASSVYSHTRDVGLLDRASSVYSHTRDVGLLDRASSVYSHVRGTPEIPLLAMTVVDFISGQLRLLQTNDEVVDSEGTHLTKEELATVTVDLKVMGNTILYTVPAGKDLLVTEVLVRITSSADITTPASVSVGVDPSTTNVIGNTELVGSILSGITYTLDIFALATVATPGLDILFRVNTPATGTSQIAEVSLVGLLIAS